MAPIGPGLPEEELRLFLSCDYRRLVAGLTLLAGGRVAAEDAVQEALARAWERSLRGERIESLRPWVATVATNLLRSRLRRLLAERRARERLGAGQQASQPGRSDLRVDLARALRALPRRQREAVVLHYFADLAVEELAGALRTSPGAAKGLLHRGRQSLARRLGQDYQDQDEVLDDPRLR